MKGVFSLIDSHAHLDADKFAKDLSEVIRRAEQNDIEGIISVGSDLESSSKVAELARQERMIFASAGIHPHESYKVTPETYHHLRKICKEKKVIAIGEIGLDYFYMLSPRETQLKVFSDQIQIAKELKLPIIVHSREASGAILEIFEGEKAWEVGGVMHCFSGNYSTAKKCLDMNFYLSFSGIITYKNAAPLHEVIRKIPVERMLIETDSPYLSPFPLRGKRNEPSFVKYIAEKIAQLKGLSLEDVGRVTAFNAKRLFRLPADPEEGKIVYKIRDSLYLNITNRCSNRCIFCARKDSFMVKGHYLKLDKEPSAQQIIQAVGDPKRYKEIVFCGFGEPFMRFDIILGVAEELKKKGAFIRIDTNGHANLINKRKVLDELKGYVDSISISLNAPNSRQYLEICRPIFGEKTYEEVKRFIAEAKEAIPNVTATAVGMPGIDIEACRRLSIEELGVNFRVREYNEIG